MSEAAPLRSFYRRDGFRLVGLQPRTTADPPWCSRRVGTVEDTSARFDPTVVATVEDHVMGLFHRFAYEVAAEMVEAGDTVLDIGFGEGYGAEILRAVGARYVGIEIDPAAVAHARKRYRADFRLYDGASLPKGPFDLVVSFQVIEHVADVDSWLAEA